jgi:hypothetical protein
MEQEPLGGSAGRATVELFRVSHASVSVLCGGRTHGLTVFHRRRLDGWNSCLGSIPDPGISLLTKKGHLTQSHASTKVRPHRKYTADSCNVPILSIENLGSEPDTVTA